jgi:hypothetical protein
MLGSIRSAPQTTHLSRSRRGRSRPRSGLTTGSGLTSWRRPLSAAWGPSLAQWQRVRGFAPGPAVVGRFADP